MVSRELLKLLGSCAVVGAVFWLLWQVNPTACAIVMFELPYLAGIFLAGLALGYLPVRLLGQGLTFGQRIITAMASGLGFLSILVMLLGLGGFLQMKILWLILIGVLALIALILLYRDFQKTHSDERVVFEAGRYWLVLLFALVPFLILTLLCAAIPPGVLWSAEGFGYDILEYHLQAPKEWFQAGAISFLPHNVYANFPFNAEMLYLLAMVLKGNPYQAVYLAQLIHVGFAILFIAAIWFFTRPAGLKSTCFATVAAGTCAWVPYLAPLAYVEMGMLFTGAVAMGLIFRMKDEQVQSPVRYGVLIGLVLGLCAGFKYTALAMIAAPLILVGFIFFARQVKIRRAIFATVVMSVICFVGISPYLIRNFIWTGNPVFPLGYKYFGGRGWDSQSAARFDAGHSVNENEKPIKARLEKLYWAGFKNIIADSFLAEHYKAKGDFNRANAIFNPPGIGDLPTYGLAILILPWLVFLTRRQRLSDWLLLLVFILQTLVWLFATHLQARFTIPWLIVLPFMVGRSAEAYGRGRFSIGMILITVITIASVYLNFSESYKRYLRHTYFENQPINWFGQEQAFVAGKIPGYEYLEIINKNPSAKTLLLGDVRPFYVRGPVLYWTVFNRNDFAAAAGSKRTKEVKDYLAATRPDFIFVDWTEIIRLSNSYGFDESITPTLLNNLSSPDRFTVQRVGKWGPFMEYRQRRVPAKVLYDVIYKTSTKSVKISINPLPKAPPKKSGRLRSNSLAI
ncbi:MAG: hypothetical protein WC975_08445 [Phycisphaerae bacterium]